MHKKDNNTSPNNSMINLVPPGYLVFSPQCKMLSLEPLASDVMRLFSKEAFVPCAKRHPLTTIKQNFDEDIVELIFHQNLKAKFLSGDQNRLTCCYQEITRSGENATADEKFK